MRPAVGGTQEVLDSYGPSGYDPTANVFSQREGKLRSDMRAPVQHLTGLRAFEATARHRSFVAAAAELNVTSTAVGQHVRALEAYLGVELFRRTPKGLQLTAAASFVLPDVRDAFDRLAAVTHKLRTSTPRSVLTVTVTPSFAAKWLMPRLESFRLRHPDMDIRLDVTERLMDLGREDVDLGIRYGRGDYSDVTSTLLLREDVFPVCSPRLVADRGGLREATDLANHVLIHDATNAQSAGYPSWPRWLEGIGLPDLIPAAELHLNSSLLATQAAVASQGVALGRSIIVAEDLEAGRLIRPFGEQRCAIGSAYYLVRPTNGKNNERTDAFATWLLDEAARTSPLNP